MEKLSMYAATALVAVSIFAVHNHFGDLWPTISAQASSLYQQISAAPEEWKLIDIESYPAVVTEDEKSSTGVIVGEIHASMKAEWWLFYAEVNETPFLLVEAHVDGKAIALCDDDMNIAMCDYRPSNGGGASMLELNTEQVRMIQQGKELQLVFFYNDQYVRTTRSLEGIREPLEKLLASVPAPEVTPQEEIVVPAWTLFETKDDMLGHVVLIQGPVEEGEVILSWSSAGYFEQLVPIEHYSGSEVFFKPSAGDVVQLEDVYWDHKGKRTDITIAETCKKEDKKICVFRGGVSVVMTEQDLLLMQIGRTLVVVWSDESGKHHTSNVVFGSKSYTFNNRIQELMQKDDGVMQGPSHTTS